MTLRSSGGVLRAPAARRRLLAFASAAVLAVGVIAPVAAAKPTSVSTVGTVSRGHARLVGTTSMSVGHATASPTSASTDPLANEIRPETEAEGADPQISGAKSAAHVPSAHVPRPATSSVTSGSATGFDGLNHFDNRYAGTGAFANSQFSLEPPDQALCVGTYNDQTQILESVNTVLRVRDASGGTTTDPIAINQFFGLAPEIDRTTGAYGDFTSDPKCYFDPGTSRWFLTILQADVKASNGVFTGPTSVLIAVSETDNAAGSWDIFKIVTTNDNPGYVAAGPCPCLGDQPLIGADANGFYVTTNVFPLFAGGFNGAMVYALSKADLVGGGSDPTTVRIAEPTLAEGYAYSIQPTTTPPGGAADDRNGGTEYFLSALDFNGTTDNRVAAWALTNTSSLNSTPDLGMQVKVISSVRYGQPPAVLQKDGDTPLLDFLGTQAGADTLQINPTVSAVGYKFHPATEHLNLLNSNDDRMNQTVYADGQIWGAVNTVVKSPNGATRTGIAYFIVEPGWSGDKLDAAMTKEGYISVANNSVIFPAIAANPAGDGIIGFTLAGPDYYPSAAYVTVNASDGASGVKIAAAGKGPADGFVGYRSLVPSEGGIERWGDYSAAVADADGNLWFATEYVGQSCNLSEFLTSGFTCGGTRSILANWGTWIAKISS